MYIRKLIKRLISRLFNIPETKISEIKANISIALRRMIDTGLIDDRWELPLLLNFFRIEGEGVEIGTGEGVFSNTVLALSHLAILHSVDPWKEFDRNIYNSTVTQAAHDKNYFKTVDLLKKYKNRSNILRMTSREAAQRFGSGVLDFVYIDASHSYDACKVDLEIWWPKVRVGGIFSSHDYLDGVLPDGEYCGVKLAVNEFVNKRKLKLYLTKEKLCRTWYIIKNIK